MKPKGKTADFSASGRNRDVTQPNGAGKIKRSRKVIGKLQSGLVH